MSRIATKICGLSTAETLDAALKGGASHVGFVYFPKSPRHVEIEQMAALAARASRNVVKVAVVVDPADDLLDRIAPLVDAFQLHGEESPERVAEIRRRLGKRMWKAVAVRTSGDLVAGSAFAGAADLLLYDAKTPKGSELPGGMGLRFDWTLLSGFRPPIAWGLSGGLDAGTVTEAIRVTAAPLVDVSSGVESAAGVKDVDKIAAFCKAVSQS